MTKVKIDEKRIAEVFEANPSAEKLIVCSDGTIFVGTHGSYANMHCKTFNLKSKEVVKGESVEFGSEGGEDSSAGDKTGKADKTSNSTFNPEKWEEGKYGEIKAWAESQGFEITTPPAKGQAKLVEEVTALLTAKQIEADKAAK